MAFIGLAVQVVLETCSRIHRRSSIVMSLLSILKFDQSRPCLFLQLLLVIHAQEETSRVGRRGGRGEPKLNETVHAGEDVADGDGVGPRWLGGDELPDVLRSEAGALESYFHARGEAVQLATEED